MDIGVYISELLARNGELSVPGLGFLMLQKVPGYYNDTDGKFYPPTSVVKFDPQQIDDDSTLAQYIAEQKNISPSSAKYFADKYIASVREDALVREVQVGDIGGFLADEGRLIFIPSQKQVSNPAFFGLAPVNLPTRALPPPAPMVPPPAPPSPERPSYSNFTNPPQESTPPPADTPQPAAPTTPPAAPTRDRQALIDAFNASNKGAYAEQGVPTPPPAPAQQSSVPPPPPIRPQAPPIQNTRPDIYPPMDPAHPLSAVAKHQEEEEQRKPIALFVLIGLIVIIGVGVVALKRFAPAKFEALTHIFSRKAANSQTVDGKSSDTVKIKEPEPIIPPKIDSAKSDSIKKAQEIAMDPAKAKRIADSTRKAHRADSIKEAKQRKIDAQKRKADSLLTVKLNKEKRQKEIRDSITAVKAAALAAKLEARKNKALTTVVTPVPTPAKTTNSPPVQVPVPDRNTKVPATSVQKTVTQVPPGTGDLQYTAVEPDKTWFAVAGSASSAAVAEARIAGLKRIGITAFAVKKGSTIFIAMGAYARNSEAEAAADKFKQSGVADAYITQITK